MTTYWDTDGRFDGVDDFHMMALQLLPAGGGMALDLGSAHGTMAELLQQQCFRVVASDIAKQAFKACKEKKLHTISLDVEKDRFPYPDDSLDVITCLELIEHIRSPDHLLKEAHRCLKPGALLIISTPNINWWWLRFKHLCGHFAIHDPDHITFYTPTTLSKLCEDHGFKVDRTLSLFYIPHSLKIISRWFHGTSYGFALRYTKEMER